jgi:CheY-like chemotaxis protein
MKDGFVPDVLLILSDGSVFAGNGFGKAAPDKTQLLSMPYAEAPLGEVVFNTSMGVYHEIITDPSYAGQMIVMTSVHIGNYGSDLKWNEMMGDQVHSKALIERGGHRVFTAASGRAARRALETEHVDILVTDLSMPDGDGFQLIAETSAEYPHVAIVVVTGQPLRDREALAELESGVDAVLRKPVSLRELAATLRGLA